MQVMKFGGASVKDAAAIRNVADILNGLGYGAEGTGRNLVLVVSAMDKTTNGLELLANLATTGKAAETQAQFEKLRSFHHEAVELLFNGDATAVKAGLAEHFDALDRTVQGVLLLGEYPASIYDRIMAFGELLSSTVVYHYLRRVGFDAHWADARKLIVTDSAYQQADIIWSLTEQNVRRDLVPALLKHRVVVTQGYIGATPEGRTTTLGREGSDYTASILGSLLSASAVTVWKDVPGVMSADPRVDAAHAQVLARISYADAVEMTFYGASVIHPKTLKPLHNARIPLQVKCFLDRNLPGTVIDEHSTAPVAGRIHKKQQALLQLRPRDFSFMDERLLPEVFAAVRQAGLALNLVQTSAVSVTLCVDDTPARLDTFASLVADNYQLTRETGLRMTTLLHHSDIPADLAGVADSALLVQRNGPHWHLVQRA